MVKRSLKKAEPFIRLIFDNGEIENCTVEYFEKMYKIHKAIKTLNFKDIELVFPSNLKGEKD